MDSTHTGIDRSMEISWSGTFEVSGSMKIECIT